MGSASSAPPQTAALSSGAPNGAGDDTGAMADLMGKIRQVSAAVDDLAGSDPAMAQGAQQIKSILRQMIIQAAQTASAQTPSGQAVPTAGG